MTDEDGAAKLNPGYVTMMSVLVGVVVKLEKVQYDILTFTSNRIIELDLLGQDWICLNIYGVSKRLPILARDRMNKALVFNKLKG